MVRAKGAKGKPEKEKDRERASTPSLERSAKKDKKDGEYITYLFVFCHIHILSNI